jgi:DNA-binding NarL/FixJ family response regulator
MPDLNGLEAARQIRRALPSTEVLMLTMYDSEALINKVLSVGVKGFILKSDAADVLVSAVKQLRRHKPFFTTKVSEILLDAYLDPATTDKAANEASSLLTPREREIVQLIAESKTTKEIADTLNISFKTVDTHRTNLMHKLKIHSVSELVRYAIRNQIVEP